MNSDIKRLLRLNMELEGALRIVSERQTSDTLDYLSEKYNAFDAAMRACFDSLVPSAATIATESPEVTPSDEEPVVEEPVVEEPIIDELVIEEPVAEETVIEETVIEEPVVEETVIEEPVVEETVIEKPVTDQTDDHTQTTPAQSTVNESVQSDRRVSDVITQRNARDLTRAFTVNEKIGFIRGLFCEDKNDFEYTVMQLSELDSLDEAYDYLLNELGWDIENDEVKAFMTIVTNHFNAM